MQSMVRFIPLLSWVSMVAIAPGCAVDSIDSDDEIATLESGLFEATCETAPKSADGTWGFESISAGNMYDPAGCPDQYLVGWGDLPSGQGAFANVFWEGTAPTANNCSDSRLSLGCYSESLGSWTITGTQIFKGVWTGSTCEFAFLSGTLTCPLNGDQKNRTAAKAWVCSGSGCTPAKRKVGIRAWWN